MRLPRPRSLTWFRRLFRADHTATLDDVYYCYRLLLKREPDAAGWTFYQQLLSKHRTSVQSLVEGFLASDEFMRAHYSSTQFSLADHPPQLLDLDGFQMYIPETDHVVGAALARDRAYEPHVTRLLHTLIRAGAHVLDIGANLGYFTLLAATLVGPQGHIIAVEPNPYNCLLLRSSIAANAFTHITLHQVAASDRDDVVLLEVTGSNGNIMPFQTGVLRERTRFVVRTAPLDSLVDPHSQLDVIKIDIEGAEPQAMRGLQQCIRRQRPVIISEFAPAMLEVVSGSSGQSYLELLSAPGYQLSVIREHDICPVSADYKALRAQWFADGRDHLDLLATPKE